MKGNMSQSRKAEELKRFVQNTRKINGQALDKDIQIDNVESADKLKTARNISLGGAVTSTQTAFDGSKDIQIPIDSIKEAYIKWGGKNNAFHLSPIDVSLLPELNANRLAFINNSAVKFEHSADGGATWTDVSENFNGTAICTGAIAFGNGNTLTDKSVNRQHRITIDCIKGEVYCRLAKILLNISTDGATNCMCKVEFGDKATDTEWLTYTTMNVNGYPGWNAINIEQLLIGAENLTWDKAYRYVRLTFSISGVSSNEKSALVVSSVRFVSSICYTARSAMARTGHLYTYDSEQNATFPKNLTIEGNTLKIGSTSITETQLKALLNLLTT